MQPRTLSALIAFGLAGVAGCNRAPADNAISPEDTLVEQSDNGSIAWDVDADGHVKATVKATDGRQIMKDVTGQISFPDAMEEQFADAELSPEGYLVATGPALQDDLTEMDYDLVVEGAPWSGVIFVPRGGTQALERDAKADAAAITAIDNKTGPNGGVVQVIGGERYEVVADRDTQEMRMYLLGPSFEVVDPGERVMRVGYVTTYPESLVLVREPGAFYYVGRVQSGWDPVQITLGVGFGGSFHYGIVGFHFGERVYFGAHAPMLRVMAARAWTPSVSVRVGVDVHVNERVNVDARVGGRVDVGGHVGGHVDGDMHGDAHGHVDADAHGGGHMDADARGRADAHASGHADAHGQPSHGGGHSSQGHPSSGGHGKKH
jgi:hypothetical protein